MPQVSIICCPCGTPEHVSATRASVERLGLQDTEFILPNDDNRVDLNSCKGDYVLFLSPGDELLTTFPGELREFLERAPDLAIFTTWEGYGGASPRPETPNYNDHVLTQEEAVSYAGLAPFFKLFRRVQLLQVQGASPLHTADAASMLECTLRHILASQTIATEHVPVAPCSNNPWKHCLPPFFEESEEDRTPRPYLQTVATVAASLPVDRQGKKESESPRYMLARHICDCLYPAEGTPRTSGYAARTQAFTQAFKWAMAALPHTSFLKKVRACRTLIRKARKACNRATRQRAQHQRFISERVQAMRQKEVIKVLFLIHSLPVWKADGLMQKMLAHPRFEPTVAIVTSPYSHFAGDAENSRDILRRYMKEQGYPTIELTELDGSPLVPGIPAEYDILYYPLPYENFLCPELEASNNEDRLQLSVMYAFHGACHAFFFTHRYQRNAWFDCFENEYSLNTAILHRRQFAANGRVTGHPMADVFLHPLRPHVSPWKPQPNPVKKIIWAPHWTIQQGSFFRLSNFLTLAEQMLQLARETQGELQWAFKPHPLLWEYLSHKSEWGEERTKEYYQQWADGPNTQLERGEYAGLFMHSDAMVHDSGSFRMEYLFANKPVLFLGGDDRNVTRDLTETARVALEAHYKGKGIEAVRDFITRTVLGGDDPLKPIREDYLTNYLAPPNGRSAAENIIESILHD